MYTMQQTTCGERLGEYPDTKDANDNGKSARITYVRLSLF